MIQFLGVIFLLFLGLNGAEQESRKPTLYRQWAPVTVNCTCTSYPHVNGCDALPQWKKFVSSMVKVTGPEYEVRGVCEGRGERGNQLAQYVADFLNKGLKEKVGHEVSHENMYGEVYRICLEARDSMIQTFVRESKMSGCAFALLCYHRQAHVGKVFHIGSSRVVHIKNDGEISFSTVDNDHTTSNLEEIMRLKSITGEHGLFQSAVDGVSLLRGKIRETRLFGMTEVYGKKHEEICVPSGYDITVASGDTVIVGTRVLMEKITPIAPFFFQRLIEPSRRSEEFEHPVLSLLVFISKENNPLIQSPIVFTEDDEGSLHVITTA